MVDSRRWDTYRPRKDDIVIATYPKCGTTWMQQIVGLLIFQTPEPRPVGEMAPWVDRRLAPPVAAVFGALDAQTHRRFLKSHVPFDAMPTFEDVRYIHVARDGRDACLSYHNHVMGFTDELRAALDKSGLDDETIRKPYPDIPADPAEYFRKWVSEGVCGEPDGMPFLSYFNLEKSYWRERRRANLLMVHYRDLKADLAGEMRRIARFLDIEVPERVFPELVEAATFAAMRREGAKLHPRLLTNFRGGAERFFNKGENDRWRGVLNEDDVAAYRRKVKASLSPACAAWLEQGRLGSGDPREAAD
jgi:aryl sulfotransferase